jgi:DNA polymerase III subunit delta
MIIKSFELNKINLENNNFYLLYGENEGHKNETIQKKFKANFLEKTYIYEEKDVIDKTENFFNTILSKSFFENEKLIVISRATDKINDIMQEIIEKNYPDIKIILNSGVLEKKSKLRNLFEKNKNTICIPFYADNNQTLGTIVSNFFKEKKIPISQQTLNVLVERSKGDRNNLKNELDKIENYIKGKKKITLDEIIKITNLAENYNVSELIDNCLAKNSKKTVNILSENNFSPEDCIIITRTLLMKSKRLHNLISNNNETKNIDSVISSYKPAIFWKDKEIVKQQIKNWDLHNAENLIYKTNEIELLIKKNNANSINILSDFIISQSLKTNNLI